MANNKLWHTEYGELDLHKPDLGRPDLPGLWERLRDDRRPVPQRQLQCGGICRTLGYVEWMHVYERQGQRIAAHESKRGERRHESNESDEHKAYTERTVRAAEEGGHRAEAEARSADGKIRNDVLVHGAGDTLIGFECQRSLQSAPTTRKRDAEIRGHGILTAWHTDRRDMFERNEVAWTRTDNDLHPKAILNGAHLYLRGGFRLLDMERCDERRARPCPTKKTGRCGKWHPVSTPSQIHYDDFVRGVASGDFVQAAVKEFRETFRFWSKATDLARYEDSLGRTARPDHSTFRKPVSGASEADPTCRARPRIEASRVPHLNWRSADHWARHPSPCRLCGKPTQLLDGRGLPAHKVCVEEEQAS